MLGLNKDVVELVEHTDEWKDLFKQEKALLENLIGEHVISIEHIGSTAIGGIAAKPLLDLMIGVRSLNDVENFDRRKLKEAGIYHLGRVEIEGKLVYAKFSDLKELTKTHVYHVVEHESDWWHRHTAFRDYLMEHPEIAKDYETLKKALVQLHPENEAAYAEGKKQFIDDVLRLSV